MRKVFPIAASLAALALAACGGETPAPEAGDTGADAIAAATDTGALPAATDVAATTPQGFVDAAAASDMFEIESSKLAATMAKNEAVKEFAQMMVDEHTKSSAELKSLAGQASPQLAVTPKLTATQQADLDALKASGDGFDRIYVQKQVAAHEAALALLRGYSANGDHAELKAFAGKLVPAVSSHLSRAREINPASTPAL